MALISVTLALESLKQQCETVDADRARLARSLALRDTLIRDARDAKVPARTLGRITGLSRDRINTIAAGRSQAYQGGTEKS